MKLGYAIRKRVNKLHELLRKVFQYYDYASWLLISPAKFKFFPKQVKKVLLVNPTALGDNLYTIRMANNLIKNNPGKEFFLLVSPENKKNLSFVENLISLKIISEDDIKKNKFDLSLFFVKPDLKKYRANLGYCVGRDYSSVSGSLKSYKYFFMNKQLPPSIKNIHYLEEQMRISELARLKVNRSDLESEFIIPKPNKKVSEFLKQNKISQFIIIHPGGKNFASYLSQGQTPSQLWPLERYSEIADYAVERLSSHVLITGVGDEKILAESIIKNSRNKKKVLDVTGKFSIEELLSLVNRARLVLVADTSMAHIAVLVGTPLINMFGPGSYDLVGSYHTKNHIVLYHKETCLRCKRKIPCPEGDNICMKAITVEEVKKSINSLTRSS